MSFLASKVVWFFVSPGGILLIALLAASVGVRRAPAPTRRLVRSITGILLMIAVLPVGRWLAHPLEERFPAVSDLSCPIDGIIVLGGSIDPGTSASRDSPQLRQSAERLVEFFKLSRRYPDAKLVFAGGTGSLTDAKEKEAPWARRVLTELGLAESRLVIEDQSRNTHENALLAKAVAHPLRGERWLLITSAMHMPRAVGVFRRVEWNVTPVPVDFRTPRRPIGFHPAILEHSLSQTAEALHEWLGLVAYWLLGRTSELFPTPEPPCAPVSPDSEA